MNTQNLTPTSSRVICGYAAATLAACLIDMWMRGILSRDLLTGGYALMYFVFDWGAAVGLTFIPCIALSAHCRREGISPLGFFLFIGVLMGLYTAAVVTSDFWSGVWGHWYRWDDDGYRPSSTTHQILHNWSTYCVGGGTGGVIFWAIAGRLYRQSIPAHA
jgi:hypothetical protein